jgi:MFS family permease
MDLDRPISERTDEAFEAEVQRNYRRNFTANSLDVASYFFGTSFLSSTTIVPLFISKLTASPIPIGIAALLAQGAWSVPQIFTANLIEQSPSMKAIVVRIGFFLERLPTWVLVLSTFIAVRSPILALTLFLLGNAWQGIGAGLIAPAWQDLIARCFPVQKRGRFLGSSSALGTLTGVAGAALTIWLLSAYAFPRNFTIIFVIASSFNMLSWFFLSLVHEPIPPHLKERTSQHDFLSGLPELLRSKHNFRRYFISRLLMAMGGMGSGFLTLAAIRTFQVDDRMVGLFTTAQLLGNGLGNLLLGLLADRHGHILSLKLSSLASALSFLIAWLAPNQTFFLLVFLLLGLSSGGFMVSGILVALEFAEPERRPTYVGIASTGIGIAGMIAPMIGTAMASFSFEWLFGISTLISFIALIAMHLGVKEPRFNSE